MKLPPIYQGLSDEPGPRMLLEALKLYGTLEIKGPGNNPTITAWADEVAAAVKTTYARWVDDWYNSDSIAWCGLFMAVVAVRAGNGRLERLPPPKYLSALDWLNYGRPIEIQNAMLGDILVFQRQGGGHVAMYVGEDNDAFHILGGNQSDAVTIARKLKKECVGVCRPIYLEQPTNIRKLGYSATGFLSTNEA